MKERKFEHGDEVVDEITGFSGIVTGHCDYITGCDQYLVQPQCKKDGSFVEPKWWDENRLKIIENKKVKLKENEKKLGADVSAPVK